MNYQLLDLLRSHNLSNTTARQVVFQALKQGPPLTIRELTLKTASEFDRASLYRTLNLFRELGVVQDIVIGGRRKVELTDAFSPHHHHLACRGCGKTIAIHNDEFEHQIESLASDYGFQHESHSFEVSGLCSTCLELALQTRADKPNL